MHHTLLISKDKTRTRYALLDENKLPIEFGTDHPTQRNAIYNARVLDVKPAFGMVFFDLSPHYVQAGLFSTTPTQAKKFQIGQFSLVQIRFAPPPSIKTHSFLKVKGPKITPELRFSCPYFIYFPQTAGVFYSKRLEKRKIEPFLSTLKSLLSPQEGLILRPLCTQATFQSLQDHLKAIKKDAQTCLDKRKKGPLGTCLYEAPSSLFQKLEEVGFSLSTIIVDDKSLYEDTKGFVQKYQLPCMVEFKLNNPLKESLFESFSLEEKWEEALSPFVPLPSGGNLTIEKTEGFWAVDINSQGREGILSALSPKTLNEEAAKTLFHTIRLRNLSGKIIIDFLPFPQKEDSLSFHQFLKKYAALDPISSKISNFSQTGLCEITRERIESSLLESVESV